MKKMSLLFFCTITFIFLLAQSKQVVQPNISLIISLQWYRLGFACFNLGNYDGALSSYKKALESNASPQLQTYLYSRIARVYASENDHEKTLESLDKAITAGYFNFNEMDTLKEFSHLQQNEKFKELRNKAYAKAYPCTADPKAREFDFWVGEWNAYPTGSNVLAGHSVIQIVSGGCMILENWTSAVAPFNGKSMNFIDESTGKWEQVWVGSNGGGANFFVNGEYRDSAMRFDFEQTDPKGNKLNGRFTFFNQRPNQIRQLNETSPDNGKTWNTVYDFTYIRK
jgi:tetratricopeptide (TPR) repeat protein